MELKWGKFIRHLFADAQPIMKDEEEITPEYIRYAISVEQTLRILEAGLHTSDDAHEIAISALKKACEFYQADWCGFLEIDLELGLWTVMIGYSTDEAVIGVDHLDHYESADLLPRWIKAMKDDRPMIVENAETVKETYPNEYALYQHLNVESVLAVPIRPRPFGFLLVRNPKRHLRRPNLLQLLGVVILQQINTMVMDDGLSMTFSPDEIQNDKDILIRLFGNLEIFTSRGVLTESKMNSPLLTALIGYLVTNKISYHGSMNLAKILYHDKALDMETPGKNIKSLLYRFRQEFSPISPYKLIITKTNGYHLNDELHIVTDLEQFDLLWDRAQHENTIIMKVEYLKKAIELYRGDVLSNISGELWVIPLAAGYHCKYHEVVNELLKTLIELENYIDAIKYATDSLLISPDNKEAYYWMAIALDKRGLYDMLEEQLGNAKKKFLPEEYKDLINNLKKRIELPCFY